MDRSDLEQICQPLFKATNASYFSHIREHANGSRKMISTCPAWSEYLTEHPHVCVSDALPNQKTVPGKTNDLQYHLWSSLETNMDTQSRNTYRAQLAIASDGFGISNGALIIVKNEQYIDAFNVATRPGQNNFTNCLLNNTEALRKFILQYQAIATQYFSESGWITEQLSANTTRCLDRQLNKQDCVNNTGHTTIAQLTKAERTCLYWACAGKTAYETAIILNCSRRTVEKHYTHIREKFNCYKLTRVCYMVGEMGIFDL